MIGDWAKQMKQDIFHGDPYEGFEWEKYPDDLTGGIIHDIWKQVFEDLRPTMIIEVGSWKGKSAVNFAQLALKYEPEDLVILCVDTWLGSDPVHQWSHREDLTWGMRDMFYHGYPTIYYQFLSNICRHKLQNIVVPFPNTSNVAARWLQSTTIQADLIYVDAGHDEEECYLDVSRFWTALRPGGLMAGDDFHANWHGVICAVSRFSRENKLTIMRSEGDKWFLVKPG
jgi:hypothetical protein